MKQIKSILIAFLFFSPVFFIIYFYQRQYENALKEDGVKTIGITYDSNIFGGGGTLHYFFKTPNGIYMGATIRSHIKCPGYYYVVVYSSKEPTVNEFYEDSLVEDSIGKKFIRFEEVDPEHYMNRADYP